MDLTVIAMIAGAAVLLLCLVAVIALVWAIRKAPEGYESETGFHYALHTPPNRAPAAPPPPPYPLEFE